MAESTLILRMEDLQSHVGDYLGWGRGPHKGEEEWTDRKLSRINELLDTALRWVYFEATVDGRPPHQWSWLTPVATIPLAAGERSVTLPDDFNGFTGPDLVVSLASGSMSYRVKLSEETFADARYAQSETTTGRPQVAAVRAAKGVERGRSSRHELYVWPEADQAYTLKGRYNLTPDALSSAWPFAYGGAAMAECFRAACRAAAERDLDNLHPGQGVEWAHFARSLGAAIGRDGRLQPKTLGRNMDFTDPSRRFGGRGWWSSGMIGWIDPLTVDGVDPDV